MPRGPARRPGSAPPPSIQKWALLPQVAAAAPTHAEPPGSSAGAHAAAQATAAKATAQQASPVPLHTPEGEEEAAPHTAGACSERGAAKGGAGGVACHCLSSTEHLYAACMALNSPRCEPALATAGPATAGGDVVTPAVPAAFAAAAPGTAPRQTAAPAAAPASPGQPQARVEPPGESEAAEVLALLAAVEKGEAAAGAVPAGAAGTAGGPAAPAAAAPAPAAAGTEAGAAAQQQPGGRACWLGQVGGWASRGLVEDASPACLWQYGWWLPGWDAQLPGTGSPVRRPAASRLN